MACTDFLIALLVVALFVFGCICRVKLIELLLGTLDTIWPWFARIVRLHIARRTTQYLREQFRDQRRHEEERRRHEEERRHHEEELRLHEEERRHHEEDRRRQEEWRRRNDQARLRDRIVIQVRRERDQARRLGLDFDLVQRLEELIDQAIAEGQPGAPRPQELAD
jgi:biopolymer transport protein ExbB/TolQ